MVEAVISSSYWKWLMDHHGRGALRYFGWGAIPVSSSSQQRRAAVELLLEMEQLGDARECLTCAVTQITSSISSNPQGYHCSFPFLMDCFCHHKSRYSGFGKEGAITLKGCSALPNIQLGCGSGELQLQRFTWTLHSVYNKMIHWLSHRMVCAYLVTLCA